MHIAKEVAICKFMWRLQHVRNAWAFMRSCSGLWLVMRQCINHLALKTDLDCAAQAVLICGYYIVRQKFLQAKRASFPHRQWTLWKTKKKKQKNSRNKYEKENKLWRRQPQQQQQQPRKHKSNNNKNNNWQLPNDCRLRSVSSCSRESSARERSTKAAPDGITSAAEQWASQHHSTQWWKCQGS